MNKEERSTKIDWESLQEELKRNPIKHTTLIVEAPRFPPPKVLRSVTEGIFPFLDSKSKKYKK